MRKEQGGIRRHGMAALLGAVVASAGWGVAFRTHFADAAAPTVTSASTTTAVTPKTQQPAEARSLSAAFAATAKAVRPSVVRVDVEREAPRLAQAPRRFTPSRPEGSPFFFFERFFDFGDAPDASPIPRPSPIAGTGSGVILDGAGHIVTNSHVVEDASTVKITLHDGQEITARIVGRDPRTDVAVLRIDKAPKNLVSALRRFGSRRGG